MKFTVKCDCTAEEARQFLGLPNVQGFQEELMEVVKQRTSEHLKSMDAESIMKTWMPMGVETVNTMQQMFMKSMAGMQPNKTDKD